MSTSCEVTAWGHQAPSHYLRQCWPRTSVGNKYENELSDMSLKYVTNVGKVINPGHFWLVLGYPAVFQTLSKQEQELGHTAHHEFNAFNYEKQMADNLHCYLLSPFLDFQPWPRILPAYLANLSTSASSLSRWASCVLSMSTSSCTRFSSPLKPEPPTGQTTHTLSWGCLFKFVIFTYILMTDILIIYLWSCPKVNFWIHLMIKWIWNEHNCGISISEALEMPVLHWAINILWCLWPNFSEIWTRGMQAEKF